jgi:hypothetical protein
MKREAKCLRGQEIIMTQYLLSVFDVEGNATLPPEEIEKMYADVDVVNAEMMAAGAWVFGGGLHPADTATVVTAQSGEMRVMQFGLKYGF